MAKEMTQDLTTMNRFQRDAAKRGVKATERTKSWGAEQKEKALAPADSGNNRFGKPNLPAERKLAPATPAAPAIVINGRKYSDPKLLEAKAAMAQGKTDAANTAKVRSRTLAMAQDTASIRALFEGWMASRKQFYPTPFNVENMTRAMGSVIAQSGDAVSVALLDEVFTFLNANNYLEKAIRRRGEPAALLYPEYNSPVAAAIAPVGAPHRVNVPAEIALPEGQDAKTMPFDELKKLVRAGYKPEARQ
jgi:hypothetical protein